MAFVMRISDWSSEVCSSDIGRVDKCGAGRCLPGFGRYTGGRVSWHGNAFGRPHRSAGAGPGLRVGAARAFAAGRRQNEYRAPRGCGRYSGTAQAGRSEERRVGKSVSVRVDLGGRRNIKKQTTSIVKMNLRRHKT